MNSVPNSDSNLKHLPIFGSASTADQCLKQNVGISAAMGTRSNNAVYGARPPSYLAAQDSLMQCITTSLGGKSQNPSHAGVLPHQGIVDHRLEKAFVNSNCCSDIVNTTNIPSQPVSTFGPGAASIQRIEPMYQVLNQSQSYTGAPGGRINTISRALPVHQAAEELLLKNLSPHAYQPLDVVAYTSAIASLPVVTGGADRLINPPIEATPKATKVLKKGPKRKRTENRAPTTPSYRRYQEEKWTEQYQELLKFKAEHGHCRIPNSGEGNLSLSRWVKRQRYQYKLKQHNKPSALSDERVKELEDVAGFVWDSHGAVWQERRAELEAYKQEHGNCNVPSHYPHNPKLSAWVKCQRRQYKKFIDGHPSSMTVDRFSALDRMGFIWKIRGVTGGRKSSLDLL